MIMICIDCYRRKTVQPFRSAIEKKWLCWKCEPPPVLAPVPILPPKPFKVEVIKSKSKRKKK